MLKTSAIKLLAKIDLSCSAGGTQCHQFKKKRLAFINLFHADYIKGLAVIKLTENKKTISGV